MNRSSRSNLASAPEKRGGGITSSGTGSGISGARRAAGSSATGGIRGADGERMGADPSLSAAERAGDAGAGEAPRSSPTPKNNHSTSTHNNTTAAASGGPTMGMGSTSSSSHSPLPSMPPQQSGRAQPHHHTSSNNTTTNAGGGGSGNGLLHTTFRSGSSASAAGAPSFIELIKAREMQQLRIRHSLEEQNNALQSRLRSAMDSSNSTQNPPSVSINEFISFVSEIKELVMRGHEAEVAAFKALNDKVDQQEEVIEQRMRELEGRLIATERSNALVREEQTDQTLAISSELERVKEVTAQLEAQVAAHEESSEQTVVFSEKVSVALQDLEERVVAVEAIPSTVRQTLVEMEVRLSQVQLEIQEELRKIRERYPDTEDKLTLVMTRAEENLLLLQQHADAAIMAGEQQQARIEELIENGITALGRGLEGMLNAKYSEHALRLTEDHEQTKASVAQQEASIMSAVTDLKGQVDAYLEGLDAAHSESVTRSLAKLEERAAAFEEERRKQYPVAEADRIEMMMAELDKAFVAVEGVVRAHMTDGVNLDHPYVQRLEALESKIAYLEGAPEKVDADAGPKIFISTDTQTDASREPPAPLANLFYASAGASGPLSSVPADSERADRARFKSQLKAEEEIISTSQSAEQIAKTVDLIVSRASSRPTTPSRARNNFNPSSSSYPPHSNSFSASGAFEGSTAGSGAGAGSSYAYGRANVATPTRSTAPTPRDGHRDGLKDVFPNPNPYSVSASASSPPYGGGGAGGGGIRRAEERSVMEADLKKKEMAVDRIQTVLKEIAAKFSEISDKEIALEKDPRYASPETEEARRHAAAVIAHQKGQIYEKERALLEKRNSLLREIREMKASLSLP